ncbi:polyadenylate-binding protein-interacting protein 9-like [Phalaenopsis equestris]|uniref:polyadenylate-binding protein-interacting protein 9-like n=1 Tax=Phalaenopsis equestris TaxID=78828 RepID=UPI0009E2B040|nr:polyadenylate-binding protein-interacting protein 9-like [Phalaenopsis equestris]
MAAVAESAIGSENQLMHCNPATSESESEYQNDVRKLVDLLSKLNPSAKEFVPSWRKSDGRLSADAPLFVGSPEYYNSRNESNYGSCSKDWSSDGSSNNQPMNRRRFGQRRNGYNQGRRRISDRVRRAEREESIKRTVYVSDIDQNITEEQLAELFSYCGQVSARTSNVYTASARSKLCFCLVKDL